MGFSPFVQNLAWAGSASLLVYLQLAFLLQGGREGSPHGANGVLAPLQQTVCRLRRSIKIKIPEETSRRD